MLQLSKEMKQRHPRLFHVLLILNPVRTRLWLIGQACTGKFKPIALEDKNGLDYLSWGLVDYERHQ